MFVSPTLTYISSGGVQLIVRHFIRLFNPHEVRKAKSIARTLWINHFSWVDVLVVRGRCVCSHNSYFRSSRVLEHLRWNLDKIKRPYMVYKEGSEGIGG